MGSETVIWDGIRFRRYPKSKRRTDRLYFTPGGSDRQRGVKRLHEEVWRKAHGEIPRGHHVHHRDGDPLNNALANLECLPGAEHLSHHGKSSRWTKSQENQELLRRIRPLAAKWHRSKAGREWHRKHSREIWEDPKVRKLSCDQCGKGFESTAGRARFCSNACKTRFRFISGVDNERRTCAICGGPFECNRFLRKRTCSRACGARLATRTKGAGL